MIALALPYPPTSNHNTMVANGRRISTPGYRAWSKRAIAEACDQLGRPVALTVNAKGKTVPDPDRAEVSGPYSIAYVAQRPDRRRRDVENLPKSISDALQAAGVIRDDADCERSSIEWATGAPAGKQALVLVRITPA